MIKWLNFININLEVNKMYIKDIISKGKFLPDKPNKEDILKTDNFNIVVVCLEKDQEITPHPEPYACSFL